MGQQCSFAQEIRWLKQEKGSATKKDIERLKKGEPIDYVVGFVNFLGCRIDLLKRPFIPRPETEFWVEQAIQKIQNPRFCILDMFAGSGCIGIALLKACPELCRRVDFAEKEKKFLEQIKINAKLNGIDSKRYQVIQSDIFSNIKGKYDYIFANPPYIAESKKSKVQKSVLENEPRSALFGGEKGLKYIRKFLKEAKNHLSPSGKIYMEFDSFQKPQISKIMRPHNFANIEFFRDQYKKWRDVVIE